MSDFFVVAVWLILRKCCHFKRMHWSSALILYAQPAMSAIGYLPRRSFWHHFCVNLSIQTQYISYQHPGDDGINAHIPAYGTRIEQEWMVSPLFFFITVVVMYWEARMRIHQQKHTLEKPFFYVLFITNHKLNRGPSGPQLNGSIFFREPFHP